MHITKQLARTWKVRTNFYTAGVSPTPNANPAGACAEALVAAALWVDPDPVAAVARARTSRRGTQDGWGPALGSMPRTPEDRTNPSAVDLVAPWATITAAVPGLAGFAAQRRQARAAWDTAWAQEYDRDLVDPDANYSALARVQVKSRFTETLVSHPDHNAVPFGVVRERSIPDNDLFVLVLFALRDENNEKLNSRNFVGTCVVLTDEKLQALDSGQRSAKLGWAEVHRWWANLPDSMPSGAHDVTPLLRGV